MPMRTTIVCACGFGDCIYGKKAHLKNFKDTRVRLCTEQKTSWSLALLLSVAICCDKIAVSTSGVS